MQEVCKKAGDVFACAHYGPGEGAHAEDPRVILRRRTQRRADAVQAMCALLLPKRFAALSGKPSRPSRFAGQGSCDEVVHHRRPDVKSAQECRSRYADAGRYLSPCKGDRAACFSCTACAV